MIDYDNTLSPQTRPDFLGYLTSKCKVYVSKPRSKFNGANEEEEDKEKLNINGYIVIGGEGEPRVLALYARSQQIADTLLGTYLKESKTKAVYFDRNRFYVKLIKVTFCAIRDHWSHLSQLAHTTERPIFRRHTRAVPAKVEWDRIFVVNVGMNLF